jgi:hypothetical protein
LGTNWYSINKRNAQENTATVTAKFRDFRVTEWIITYKTFFANDNCIGTSWNTIDNSNPTPTQLVPFTELTFGS